MNTALNERYDSSGCSASCSFESRRIPSGKHVAEEPQPKSTRGDRQPRELDGEDGKAKRQQAAVNATGLAKLFST